MYYIFSNIEPICTVNVMKIHLELNDILIMSIIKNN